MPGSASVKQILNGTFTRSSTLYKLYKRFQTDFPSERKRSRMRVQFYARLFPSGIGLCFDIGANHGNRVEALLKIGSEKVIAIEPQSHCVKELKRRFGKNDRCEVLEVAVGASAGEETLFGSSIDTLSTLSEEYMNRVSVSRFQGVTWGKVTKVKVVTLDSLIARYGVPEFCKIDVEGFELQVLQGLSRPIPLLSFEFSSEMIDQTLMGISHLSLIGMACYNVSLGESSEFTHGDWLSESQLIEYLQCRRGTDDMWGDVYARHRP